MANTIAYTSGNSLTGSLKSGVISINLNDQIIGQNYNWRNGIVFSNQYIIYSDTFTQGIDTEANAKPCAWACDYNNTALLNLINSYHHLSVNQSMLHWHRQLLGCKDKTNILLLIKTIRQLLLMG